MAKNSWTKPMEDAVEMTMDEAKAFRASLYKPVAKVLSDIEKKEAFRKFWALNKAKYSKAKDVEGVLWEHLVATKNDVPELFLAGIVHFGLSKISK